MIIKFYYKINDFPTPKTWMVSNKLIMGECIAKPRFEVGGRGFVHCKPWKCDFSS